jgi:hypothetical protein
VAGTEPPDEVQGRMVDGRGRTGAEDAAIFGQDFRLKERRGFFSSSARDKAAVASCERAWHFLHIFVTYATFQLPWQEIGCH